MNYRQYTPREIAAFLEPHRAALVELIQRAAKITGCTCWQSYVYDLERGGIATRARLEQLYQYIVDAAVGIGRTMPTGFEKATAAALMHEAGGLASFLTAEEEDSRKTAADMLNAAAARHAAESRRAVANTRAPRRKTAAPVVHACSAVIGKR